MEEEIQRLKEVINQSSAEIKRLESLLEIKNQSHEIVKLSSNEISKYSRQLILPEIGVSGQICLKKMSVLIVGAGGLGCPVATYLAAAGVGSIGIVDHDVVDVSNLHRQVAHKFTSIGMDKSKSLVNSLKELNPDINCYSYSFLLNSQNIEDIISRYSIIVDASDNVPTRYLLNDAAVLFKKPLVSGSALRFEGQLTVYNYKDGPCYRCLFPKPPSVHAVGNCSDSGVLGPVTGVIGCLQAMEVIKIAVGLEPSYHKRLLMFDGITGKFRDIKLRSKVPDCAVCGNEPTITKLIDYEVFCGVPASDNNICVDLLPEIDRVSCVEYKRVLDSGRKHILVDVRPTNEFSICALPNSINIPINKIYLGNFTLRKRFPEGLGSTENYVVCRRGNDSQVAVRLLQKADTNSTWRDIKGGLHAWHDEIDPEFPKY